MTHRRHGMRWWNPAPQVLPDDLRPRRPRDPWSWSPETGWAGWAMQWWLPPNALGVLAVLADHADQRGRVHVPFPELSDLFARDKPIDLRFIIVRLAASGLLTRRFEPGVGNVVYLNVPGGQLA